MLYACGKKRGEEMVYIMMLCMVIPLLLLMTMLQKQSRLLLAFMLCGMVLATCAYEINSLFCELLKIDGPTLSVKVAPIVEETLKACPVLLYAVLVTDEKKQIFQLAMAVGIGFALLENAFLLITYADLVDLPWAIVRGISTSLSHGICTMIVGCGIIFVRKQKKLFYTGTFALLAAAITFHAIFNLLVQSAYDYVALALPIIVYACYWIVKLKPMSMKEKS